MQPKLPQGEKPSAVLAPAHDSVRHTVSDPLSPATKSEVSTAVGWRRWYRSYQIEILLFVLIWTTYAYFYQSTGTNEAVRFDQIRALTHDHTLAIDKYCYNSPDLIRYPNDTGRLYPNKAPGLTLIGNIPFALLSPVFGLLRALDGGARHQCPAQAGDER